MKTTATSNDYKTNTQTRTHTAEEVKYWNQKPIISYETESFCFVRQIDIIFEKHNKWAKMEKEG